jgi:hypothetical protein
LPIQVYKSIKIKEIRLVDAPFLKPPYGGGLLLEEIRRGFQK